MSISRQFIGWVDQNGSKKNDNGKASGEMWISQGLAAIEEKRQ